MSACTQGNARRAAVAIASADLGKVARLATRDGVPGERAQRRLPPLKQQLDLTREALKTHLTDCHRCADAGVSA